MSATIIRWTDSAEEAYLVFLQSAYNYSSNTALHLDEQLDALLERLKLFKHHCPPLENHKYLRRCMVAHHIALVYDVSGNEITIISVFDTRSKHPFN